MGRKYNIVVFGAAGFTGKHLILEIVKTLDEKDEQFSWAVSGRSTSKLDVVLQEMSKASGNMQYDIPIISWFHFHILCGTVV